MEIKCLRSNAVVATMFAEGCADNAGAVSRGQPGMDLELWNGCERTPGSINADLAMGEGSACTNIKTRRVLAWPSLAASLVLFAFTASISARELSPDGGLFDVKTGTVLFPLRAGNGLSGFWFEFKDPDHHISKIDVLLDCPGASYGCPEDTAWLNYQDKEKRAYSVDLNWQPLPEGTRFGSGVSEPDLPSWVRFGRATPDTVPVLTGFALHKDGGDMHLKEFQIFFNKESDGQLYGRVGFDDDSGSDTNSVITFGEVPSRNVRVLPEICGESGGGFTSGAFVAERPVLTRIYLKYKHGDHHVKRIGVKLIPPPIGTTGRTLFRITLEDRNGDDDFEYCIGVADIRP